MNNYNDVQQIDSLALLGTFLGVLNYMENLKQTSNDDLMVEMRHQNVDFLEVIIEQNKEIISLLKGGSK